MAKRRGAKTEDPPGAMVCKIIPDLLPLARPIDTLIPDPENANEHDEASIAAIVASYSAFGQRKPIVVNIETMIIESGNGQWAACKRLGWTHIAAVLVRDDPATATGFAIADNRTAQFAKFNLDLLLAAKHTIDELDPDLAAALQLDLLLPSVSAEAPAEPIEIPSKYSILIECISETQQREIYERLQAGNYPPAKCLTI